MEGRNPDVLYAAIWRAKRTPWTIISGGGADGILFSLEALLRRAATPSQQ